MRRLTIRDLFGRLKLPEPFPTLLYAFKGDEPFSALPLSLRIAVCVLVVCAVYFMVMAYRVRALFWSSPPLLTWFGAIGLVQLLCNVSCKRLSWNAEAGLACCTAPAVILVGLEMFGKPFSLVSILRAAFIAYLFGLVGAFVMRKRSRPQDSAGPKAQE